ncbi:hypothetical protein [Paenibacillus sp. sgz302251]|uniref:hypothetical protein n=1 Tax=Paenibacillus sp. sgz302251 TaxID=3414493 RepID=UPI003C7B3D27
MPKFKKVLSLTLLISLCMFPATVFASSNQYSSDSKKSLFTNLFLIFTGSDKDYTDKDYKYDDYKDKDWGFKDFLDSFDKDKNWWDDSNPWDDPKKDSYSLWEKYYCY